MLSSGLKAELRLFFGMLFIFILLGLIFSYTALFLAFGAIAYCLRLFHLIYTLENWFSRTRRLNFSSPPVKELTGVWSELSYQVELIFLRHLKQKKRLRKIITRVRKMGSALSEAVILLDDHENIEWWNENAEKLFSLKPQDMGHKLTNIIRHPGFVRYFEGKTYEHPLEFTLPQSDQHVEIKIHPFGKKEKLVFARDITRIYRLELMRKDFVGNVSHELRTPLTVLRGYVETFSDCDIPKEWLKAFQQMQQQCLRMDDLISDLIILSKLETDEVGSTKTVVNVSTLLQVLMSDLAALSGDKKIIINCTDDLEILGNEGELRSAISNLVVNAINYSNAQAEIKIDCERLEKETVIKVIDTGIGIDSKHLSRITERFYRVDPSRSVDTGGTGLGLAIVKHALLRHNGELKITSKLGKGSIFSCHFPRLS